VKDRIRRGWEEREEKGRGKGRDGGKGIPQF